MTQELGFLSHPCTGLVGRVFGHRFVSRYHQHKSEDGVESCVFQHVEVLYCERCGTYVWFDGDDDDDGDDSDGMPVPEGDELRVS